MVTFKPLPLVLDESGAHQKPPQGEEEESAVGGPVSFYSVAGGSHLSAMRAIQAANMSRSDSLNSLVELHDRCCDMCHADHPSAASQALQQQHQHSSTASSSTMHHQLTLNSMPTSL